MCEKARSQLPTEELRGELFRKAAVLSYLQLSSLSSDAVGRRISRSTCHRETQKMGSGTYKVSFPLRVFLFSPKIDIIQGQKKPLLTPLQKQNRFRWAKQHKNWTPQQWHAVQWSDESRLEVCVGGSRSRVIRKKQEAFHLDCLKRKVKFPALVMIWSSMSAKGIEKLHFIKGTNY
ncbi:hypothetical protein ILUMI_22648 [Ignelater luminosus]|uniref:Transposase n=1 Tax=Ignelater luminosus TaxID=2038154 RepID=A0A8K0CDZ2_IGNLU|nr:hypothetical protein ILUMI_22648 [Ignelater luminosus]